DVAELATILGHSEKYVRFRASLNKLTDAWKKAMINEEYPFLKAGHYEAISRFPESVQDNIKKTYFLNRSISVKELMEDLDKRYSRLLARAPFGCDGCMDCPKCSNKEPWLFEELKDDKDCSCLDPDCWDKNVAAFVKAEVKELRKNQMRHPVTGNSITLVCNEYLYNEKPPYTGALNKYDYEMLEMLALTGIGKANAFIVSGPDTGHYCRIRINDRPAAEPAKPKTVLDKREQLQKRRVKRALVNLYGNIEAQKNKLARPKDETLLKLYSHLSVNHKHISQIAAYEKRSPDKLRDELWQIILDNISSGLKAYSENTLEGIEDKAGRDVCKVLGFSWDEFITAATEEIKTPKSLAEEM
ncbi:MAG: hypothetical protein PHH77_12975, partial [Victivallaceae bacterium]|nr:hypothetical protein [Victivallaceae bacterium]